uniref:heavy metal sensor histidine kinase n=1 Tax=Marinobacterium profundum TaxID=1714300 RepID=UPI00082E0DD9|nr:heavy metal sensor histidine kinase [Marinobacterium profundum]
MRIPTLTMRLSLMFSLAVLSVLLLAGILFKQLSMMHFGMLDQQELSSKAQSAAGILQQVTDRSAFERRLPELRALLSHHPGLAAMIRGPEGELWFAEPAALQVPARLLSGLSDKAWEWESQDRFYRGLNRELPLPGNRTLRIELVLDSTLHQRYLHSLTHWFWVGFSLCALFSAGLGWLVARNGLRPVRSVTQVVSSISAQSLSDRVPMQEVPGELQGLAHSFNSMLQRLDDDFVRLSNFSSDIAHELRTPISSLITHTEVVLSRERRSEEYHEALYSNLEELQRMAKMVEEMLFIAKADNALIVPEHQPVEMNALVNQLFEYYELLAEEDGISLCCSGQGTLMGDASMLRRALSNLLSNAIRHSVEGGTVTVGIVTGAQSLEVSVTNVGTVIPPEHIERLFDRFYRADPARREGHSSHAGLGLAITRSIVQSHGGTLACESSESSTRFTAFFPLAGDPSQV